MISKSIKETLKVHKKILDEKQFYWYSRGLLFALMMESIITNDEWEELKTKYKVNPTS